MLNGRLRMRGCIENENPLPKSARDNQERLRYSHPWMKVVRLRVGMICGCSGNPNDHDETVEFRFGVGVDGEWDGMDEIVLE